MNTITYATYEQASEILHTHIQAIKNAALNDVLTRCFHNSKRAVLIKEQVELFKDKRLSMRSLSLEETELWNNYKVLAESPRKIVVPFEKFLLQVAEQKSEFMVELMQVVSSAIAKIGDGYIENFPSAAAKVFSKDLDEKTREGLDATMKAYIADAFSSVVGMLQAPSIIERLQNYDRSARLEVCIEATRAVTRSLEDSHLEIEPAESEEWVQQINNVLSPV